MLAFNILPIAAMLGLAAAQNYGSSPSSTSSSSTAATTTASSNMHAVTVGAGGGLSFSPDTITAAVGDIVQFHFNPLNHSVVEGDISTPCKPKSGGFYSGFQPIASGTGSQIFAVTINDTKPIFFYCAQTVFTHCQSGMAGVINPGSDTLASYKAAAAWSGNSTAPVAIAGGVFQDASSSSTTSASSSSASATASGNAAASIDYKGSVGGVVAGLAAFAGLLIV